MKRPKLAVMILNPSWLETSFLSPLWISMNFFNFSCWITLLWYLCICLILHLYVYFFEFWCWICVICSPTTTFGLQLCWFLALFTFKRRHVTRKRFNKVKQQSERKIFQYIFTNHACKEDEKWQFMPDKHDQYDWITFVADLYLYSFLPEKNFPINLFRWNVWSVMKIGLHMTVHGLFTVIEHLHIQ